MLAITAMSSTVIGPRQFVRGVSRHSPAAITEAGFAGFWKDWWWLFVKGFLVFEFALLSFLLLRAMPKRGLIAISFGAAFAVADELHQTLVPARGGRLTDVLIDWSGVFLGWVVWRGVCRRKANNQSRQITPT
jgi:hypothetical protein